MHFCVLYTVKNIQIIFPSLLMLYKNENLKLRTPLPGPWSSSPCYLSLKLVFIECKYVLETQKKSSLEYCHYIAIEGYCKKHCDIWFCQYCQLKCKKSIKYYIILILTILSKAHNWNTSQG